MALFELTTEDKQALIKIQIRATLDGAIRNNSGMFTNLMKMFFQTSGLTPQQVCDALGSDAASILQAGHLLAQAVNILKPGTLSLDFPNGLEVTPNQDGTVTIGSD